MKKQQTIVTVKLNRVRKYPFRADKIVFTMRRPHAVQAVESLMIYMGYNTEQYTIASAEIAP